MIVEGNQPYNLKSTAVGDDSSTNHIAAPRNRYLNRRYAPSAKGRGSLHPLWLATRVGWLVIEPFHDGPVFDALPRQSFAPAQPIPSADLLCVVERGSVLLKLGSEVVIKTLSPGTAFGEMPILGQTMLSAKAIAGPSGARIAMMDEAAAHRWIAADSAWLIKVLGQKLVASRQDHFRLYFQSLRSAIAGLLLRLAGDGSTVEGISQQQMADMLETYRETMSIVLNEMKRGGLIGIRKKSIRILDRKALEMLTES